jgi:hypothetical protein
MRAQAHPRAIDFIHHSSKIILNYALPRIMASLTPRAGINGIVAQNDGFRGGAFVLSRPVERCQHGVCIAVFASAAVDTEYVHGVSSGFICCRSYHLVILNLIQDLVE